MPQHRNYRAGVAGQILKRIRRGETLHEILGEKRPKGWPDLLMVYDWLRDPGKKIGKVPFHVKYQQALQDRAISWQDQVVLELKSMGPENTTQEIRRIETKARLMVGLAKEQGASPKEKASKTVNVVIKKFPKPES